MWNNRSMFLSLVRSRGQRRKSFAIQDSRRLTGVSLVELLFAIAIAGILLALLLVAVSRARESARQVTCRSNLKQMGLANLAHESAKGHYPSNGWGYYFVPDSYSHPTFGQPGGWTYQILPFMEMKNVHDMILGEAAEELQFELKRELIQKPISTFACPSRSIGTLVKQAAFSTFYTNLPNPPKYVVGGHYAVNSGASLSKRVAQHGWLGGPQSMDLSVLEKYDWPSKGDSDGVAFLQLRFAAKDIGSGLSNTLWAGEKYIGQPFTSTEDPGGHDQSILSGDCRDNRRYCYRSPISDRSEEGTFHNFGSSHPQQMFGVLLDGSVQSIAFDTDDRIFQRLGMRNN